MKRFQPISIQILTKTKKKKKKDLGIWQIDMGWCEKEEKVPKTNFMMF